MKGAHGAVLGAGSGYAAHLQHVAKLDVEMAQRFEPASIGHRPRVHRIEADVASQSEDRRFRMRVVARPRPQTGETRSAGR